MPRAVKTKKRQSAMAAFTIVELLVVIVVIALLAAITTLVYSGVQKQAVTAAIKSDLRQAQTHMSLEKTNTGVYPTTTEGIAKSATTSYELTSNGENYCLTATAKNAEPHRIASDLASITPGPCQGHEYGYAAPPGVNVAVPITQWSLSGGATLSGDILRIPQYTSGTFPRANSGFIRTDGARSLNITYEIYPLVAGARPQWSSVYYAGDKSTRATNTTGHTNNGNAPPAAAAGVWSPVTAGFTLGPNVQYVTIEAWANATYNGPAEIRNVEVKLNR